MTKKSQRAYDLPFDYNDDSTKQSIEKPKLSTYVVIVLLPYMILSSIAFLGIFQFLYPQMTLDIAVSILLLYWAIVWITYAFVKFIHNMMKSSHTKLDNNAKDKIQSIIHEPVIKTAVRTEGELATAEGISGDTLKYRAKAVVHQHDYDNVFNVKAEKERRRNDEIEKKLRRQFAYIKSLIKNKQFKEARYALSVIDHPRADLWLKKLNAIDPTYSTNAITLKSLAVISIIVLLLLNLIISVYNLLH